MFVKTSLIAFILLAYSKVTLTSDITNLVFGKLTDGMPAAFGDFNSDELTDVFVLRDNGHTVEILLAHEEEPILRVAQPRLACTFSDKIITSVVPGDFDGDAFMDVLVTTVYKGSETKDSSKHTLVYVLWGRADHLNCSMHDETAVKMLGQPLAIDYNQDMIVDLFGVDTDKTRMFWVFNNTRNPPEKIKMGDSNRSHRTDIKRPHSNAFIGNTFFKILLCR